MAKVKISGSCLEMMSGAMANRCDAARMLVSALNHKSGSSLSGEFDRRIAPSGKMFVSPNAVLSAFSGRLSLDSVHVALHHAPHRCSCR